MIERSDIRYLKEKAIAEKVLADMGMDASTVICSDRPDIIIPCLEEKCIGAEVVEIFPSAIDCKRKGVSMARVSDRIYRACQRYQKKLEQDGENGIWMVLSFSDYAHSLDLGISDREFQSRVLEEIKRHRLYDSIYNAPELNIDEYMRLENERCFEYKYVERCHIHDIPSGVYVSPIYVYWSKSLEPRHVFETIQAKENKLTEYKKIETNKAIDEYWLIMNLSSDEQYYYKDDFTMTDIESGYSRIYLSQLGGTVIRLK